MVRLTQWNLDEDQRSALLSRSNLEGTPEEARPFGHARQPEAVLPGGRRAARRLEASAVVIDGQSQKRIGPAQDNFHLGRPRMLHDVVQGFLHDAEEIDAQFFKKKIINFVQIGGEANSRRLGYAPYQAFNGFIQPQTIQLKRTKVIGDSTGLFNGQRRLAVDFPESFGFFPVRGAGADGSHERKRKVVYDDQALPNAVVQIRGNPFALGFL